MKRGVVRHDPASEFWTAERCHVTEWLGAGDDPGLSIAKIRVEKGVTTALHRLTVAERYAILEGRGSMEVGERPAEEVGPGDTVCIPAGAAQRITNTGTGDLVFLCICTPAFEPDCYEDLEEKTG